MKKEFIYFTLALMLFCVGFFFGKTQNDTGRYFFSGGKLFDTKTGVVYSREYFRNREIIMKYDRTTGENTKIEIPK